MEESYEGSEGPEWAVAPYVDERHSPSTSKPKFHITFLFSFMDSIPLC
jgi:hypothetical protein